MSWRSDLYCEQLRVNSCARAMTTQIGGAYSSPPRSRCDPNESCLGFASSPFDCRGQLNVNSAERGAFSRDGQPAWRHDGARGTAGRIRHGFLVPAPKDKQMDQYLPRGGACTRQNPCRSVSLSNEKVEKLSAVYRLIISHGACSSSEQ